MKAKTTFAVPIVIFILTSCSLSGFRQAAKEEEQRISRVTDQAIEKSPLLQELNRLCDQEIAHPPDFVFESKSMDTVSGGYLTFHYNSALEFATVKEFYKNHLTQNEWVLMYEKNGGWGQPEVQFTREHNRITLFDVGEDQRHHYAIQCERL